MIARELTVLPEPDSPITATVRPAIQRVRQPVHRPQQLTVVAEVDPQV